jgi:hypothetical protein
MRWLVVLGVLGGAGAGLWFTLWDHVREHVVAGPEYQLDTAAIQITPLPAWIHSDIKADVARSASLDGSMSLLDDELTLRIAQAFGLHPWVAKVTRVSKSFPARVDVELVYRRPVAMVEVSGGLLPVDRDGVLLPSDDFSPSEAVAYPRITEIKTVPVGPQGSRWGDARVAGGARLAAVLTDDWQKMKLTRIAPLVPSAGVRSPDDILYEVFSEGGLRIEWGHAPGSERPGDIKASEKLAQLRQFVERFGKLDAANSPNGVLDLRGSTEVGRRAVPSRSE